MTILKAVAFAAEVHKSDVRKYGGEPYIYHCLRVMNEVMLHPMVAEEKYVMAAVCHDTIEDHPDVADYHKVSAVIGVEATIVVGELTNRFTSEQYPNHNRAVRKKLERNRLSACSDAVKVIKMLDRLDNLRSFGRGFWTEDRKELRRAMEFGKVYGAESVKLIKAIGDADPALAKVCTDEAEYLAWGQ